MAPAATSASAAASMRAISRSSALGEAALANMEVEEKQTSLWTPASSSTGSWGGSSQAPVAWMAAAGRRPAEIEGPGEIGREPIGPGAERGLGPAADGDGRPAGIRQPAQQAAADLAGGAEDQDRARRAPAGHGARPVTVRGSGGPALIIRRQACHGQIQQPLAGLRPWQGRDWSRCARRGSAGGSRRHRRTLRSAPPRGPGAWAAPPRGRDARSSRLPTGWHGYPPSCRRAGATSEEMPSACHQLRSRHCSEAWLPAPSRLETA